VCENWQCAWYNLFMKVNDTVYGVYEIVSPVLIELIKSQSVQRLKNIAQFGIPDKYYHLKNYTRYEHCIGVMLLLKILGASEEEQIAGLLHDVSHTAFSHVIDWVIGNGKTENYQDEQHEKFIHSSEIPSILNKYDYDAKRITDYHHFNLLERDIPDVCADRLDYSLREFPKAIAKKCMSNLTIKNNIIVFKNKSSAILFTRNFLERQMTHWGGFEAASRYRIFANMLREAMKKKIIAKEDFWKEDAFVVKKLIASKDKKIIKVLKTLEQKSISHLSQSNIVAHKKFRYVDPLFIDNNKLIRISEVDIKIAEEIESAKKQNEKGIKIPFI
jgi:HD superfamily phosphohydrolase